MPIPLQANDAHDSVLRAKLRPTGYVNPTPKPRYQLVVVGGGPAGLVAAAGAAGLGASVALVERDLLGGDCLNVGCVPSKTLLRTAKLIGEIRRARSLGVTVSEPAVDFPAVMERVRRVRAELATNDSVERFTSLGIDVFLGDATMTGPDNLTVGPSVLRFGRCILATGARPHLPELPPRLKGLPLYSNETIFNVTTLPRRLLVVGGGPIGCELGQALARFGSQVTIVAQQGRLLLCDHATAGQQLAQVFQAEGITIVEQIPTTCDFDAVLLAAGRRPNVESLNLAAARVTFDTERGISVDERLQTTNDRIFAAGDVCQPEQQFTHAADAMARVAVQNALFPGRATFRALVPWCTYTDPEVAGVGIASADLKQPVPSVEYRQSFAHLDRAVMDGHDGFLAVRVANGTDRIVGATIVGPHAGEMIGTVTLAMQNRVGLTSLARTVFPYPTYTEAIRKVADQFNRTRLTPRNLTILKTWLRWCR